MKIYHDIQIKLYRQSVFQWQHSTSFPTRWPRKPAGTDIERNYVTVILCIVSLLVWFTDSHAAFRRAIDAHLFNIAFIWFRPTIRYDTIRDAILTCARKPTWVSLIDRIWMDLCTVYCTGGAWGWTPLLWFVVHFLYSFPCKKSTTDRSDGLQARAHSLFHARPRGQRSFSVSGVTATPGAPAPPEGPRVLGALRGQGKK